MLLGLTPAKMLRAYYYGLALKDMEHYSFKLTLSNGVALGDPYGLASVLSLAK